MKYQVSVEYQWQGEFSVEADSEDEAREIVKEELFGDPWTDSSGNHQAEILEVYEWDEAAQERQRKQNQELFDKFPLGKHPQY